MLDEVEKFQAWQDSLALAAEIVAVCEEFTSAASNVVVQHLRESAVAIPSSIASDLMASRSATMEPLVRLVTEVHLVRRIYPAIDIDQVAAALTTITDRIHDGTFAEQTAEDASGSVLLEVKHLDSSGVPQDHQDDPEHDLEPNK